MSQERLTIPHEPTNPLKCDVCPSCGERALMPYSATATARACCFCQFVQERPSCFADPITITT